MDFFDIVTYVMLCYSTMLLFSLGWLFYVLKTRDFVTKELPQTEQDLVRFSQRMSTRLDASRIRSVRSADSARPLSSRGWVDPSNFNGDLPNQRSSARFSTRQSVNSRNSSRQLEIADPLSIPVAVSLNENDYHGGTMSPRIRSSSEDFRSSPLRTQSLGVDNRLSSPRGRSSSVNDRRRQERVRSPSVDSESSTASSNGVQPRLYHANTNRFSANLNSPLGPALESKRLGQFTGVLKANGLQTYGDLRVLDKDLINTLCSGFTVLERAKLLLVVSEAKGVDLSDEGEISL